jgi:large subunit ribosomal protein LP0
MTGRIIPQRKLDYAERLNHYLDNYFSCFTICVNNVGSKSIARQRKTLRPRDIHILMGKNTIMRKVLNLRAERLEAEGKTGAAEQTLRMLEMVAGNIGFVFIPRTEDIGKVVEEITSEQVQTAAKAGILAPTDVIVPAGPTGQDPSQTSFFQALDIPTKINRGQVEIVSDVKLITQGESVDRSAAELLVMLNIKPFYYGIKVNYVYSNGDVFPADVLSISSADVAVAFNAAVREVAALCLALNYPTAASVPHSIMDAYKNMLAVGLGLKDYSWDNLTKVKEILADPSAFAASAAPAASGDAAAAPAAVVEEEEEEESSVAAGGMFGGSGSGSDSDDDSDEDSS